MQIATRRVERIIDALSLLSLGQYDPALAHIEVEDADDRMSVLEQALGMFVQELVDAREENLAQVAALEQSKRDIERKLETIERQQQAIRELSTPIIELWDDILTLPIVGIVDTQRAMDMTEQLLQRIADSQARCVIVDLTGVDVIDTMTANHFMQMIRAAQLLGTYCVLTGLSPHTARTMVDVGVELGSIQTLHNLKEGLRHCLLRQQDRRQDDAAPARAPAWKA